MRTITPLLVALASFCCTGLAQAEFAEKKTLAFSADRLFGTYITRMEVDNGPFDYLDSEGLEFGLLWQGPGRTPYPVSRLGVDYFVIDHLSIGGTVAFFQADLDDDDDDSRTGFLFGPRVGGSWMFNDWAGIWPRGGLHYYSLNEDWGGGDASATQLVFNAECVFVLAPADNWAFTVGPAFDIGITGEADFPGEDLDLTWHSFGLITAGITGYINL